MPEKEIPERGARAGGTKGGDPRNGVPGAGKDPGSLSPPLSVSRWPRCCRLVWGADPRVLVAGPGLWTGTRGAGGLCSCRGAGTAVPGGLWHRAAQISFDFV